MQCVPLDVPFSSPPASQANVRSLVRNRRERLSWRGIGALWWLQADQLCLLGTSYGLAINFSSSGIVPPCITLYFNSLLIVYFDFIFDISEGILARIVGNLWLLHTDLSFFGVQVRPSSWQPCFFPLVFQPAPQFFTCQRHNCLCVSTPLAPPSGLFFRNASCGIEIFRLADCKLCSQKKIRSLALSSLQVKYLRHPRGFELTVKHTLFSVRVF
jgi:hypothetical protein